MNSFYRTLVALSTVLPISIPFAYIFADKWFTYLQSIIDNPYCNILIFNEYVRLVIVIVAVICNFCVGKFFVWMLDRGAKKLGERPIKVESVKLLGGDSLLGYLPYVLPLFITQSGMQGFLGWAIGAFALFLLAWASMTIAFSPLLGLCGLRFYEATLADRRTITLLIRDRSLSPLRLKGAAKISDFCAYGLR